MSADLGDVSIMSNVKMSVNVVQMQSDPKTTARCKYCGKPFIKKANKQLYCSDHCRKFALKEQKAKYQRARRKRIRSGALSSNETKYIGTGFLSHHRHKDFKDEAAALEKEMRRLKIWRDRK